MITRRDDQKKSVREYMRGGREFVQLTALSRELPEHARLFSVLRLIPGASIGYHEHEGETEMFYFLEGCGRVRDDHAVENTGDCDLVILAVIVTD